MSTNHTPNYSLSQWKASDQVLRTDFNEDNAALEAALALLSTGLTGKAGTWEYIGQHTNSGTFNSTSITLPSDLQINWSDWDRVVFLGDISTPDCDSSDILEFEMNPGIQTLIHLKAGSIIVFFFPHHNNERQISGFGIGSGVDFFSSGSKYREITSFFVSLSGNVDHRIHGMTFRFFGAK